MGSLFHYLSVNFSIVDLLDILMMSFIVYTLLSLIKGTRAMQMLIGLGILSIGFYISSFLEFFTIHWFFSYFFDYFIIIVIVLFQDEFRRALTQMGKNPFFAKITEEKRAMISDLAEAVTRLAKEKIGALIVIERDTGLKNFIDTGSRLDSRVQSDLIYALFITASPLHDGAVIIREGKIAAAGCFLPLSKNPNIDKNYGSRHRAAIGLTEDSDAIVILVSEESGEANLVKNGKIISNLSELEIRQSLIALLDLSQGAVNLPKKMIAWIKSTQEKNHP
jgi:diadenylate cyclase